MAADGSGATTEEGTSRASRKLARLEKKSRERDERREAKREELARSALLTLQELGYARTSLRDVAEQSGSSVGLIHYYFEDKEDLIAHCVRLYKRDFIAEVDAVVAQATGPDHAVELFVEGMAESVRQHASLHRLWDDLHAQAMFEPRFQEPVRELEEKLIAMIGRLLVKLEVDVSLAVEAYLCIHAAFHFHLFQHIAGDPHALTNLRERMHSLLARFR